MTLLVRFNVALLLPCIMLGAVLAASGVQAGDPRSGIVHDHRTGSAGIDTGRPPANPRPPGEPPPGWGHGHGPDDPRGAPPPLFPRNGECGVTVSGRTRDHRTPPCLGNWC